VPLTNRSLPRKGRFLKHATLKTVFVTMIAFVVLCYANEAASKTRKTICSMALNSSNEFEAFRKSLTPQDFDFVELVPEKSDGTWFEKACRSGTQCDVLIISGHFGGLFFGEAKSNLLELSTLESAACSKSCDGILRRPKEVFLMGCNTLANHSKDHRTLAQYLDVLINDGFPLGLAEEVAVARYGGEGLSLEERFSHLFGDQTSIYGFASTGPIGSRAAPILTKYLNSVGDYHRHLENKLPSTLNSKLKVAFGKTSYKELLLKDRLNSEATDLVCKLQSRNPEDLKEALLKIDERGLARKFIDRIRDTLSSNMDFRVVGHFPSILEALSTSVKRNGELFEVQFKNLQAMMPIVNGLDRQTLARSSQQLIDRRLAKASSLIEIQRLCQTGLENGGLTLDQETFGKIPADRTLKAVLLGCFSKISDALFSQSLKAMEMAKNFAEKEYLYFNVQRHLQQDPRYVANLAFQDGLPDSIKADLNNFSILPGNYRQCLNNASRSTTKSSRDGARWNCWQSLLPDSDLACLATLSEMELPGSKDFAWQCAIRPNLTIGRCMAIVNKLSIDNKIPSNFEQMHDDLLWKCYSTLLDNMNLEPASCLMIQRSMKIRGHKIKMQWNCMNRLPKF